MEVWGDCATCTACGVQGRPDAAEKSNASRCPLWRPVGWGDREEPAGRWMRGAQRLSLAWSEAGRRSERLQTQQEVAAALAPERRAALGGSLGAGPGASAGSNGTGAGRPGAPGGPPLRLVPYRGHEVAELGDFRICVGCGQRPPGAERARREWVRQKCPGPPDVVLPRVLAMATGPLAQVLQPGGRFGQRAAWMFQ